MKRIKDKRVNQLNVRLTDADLALIHKAAAIAWPGAVMSISAIILSLCRLKAEEIIKKK